MIPGSRATGEGEAASGEFGGKRKVGSNSRSGYKPPYSIHFYFLLLGEVIGPDESLCLGAEPPSWRIRFGALARALITISTGAASARPWQSP